MQDTFFYIMGNCSIANFSFDMCLWIVIFKFKYAPFKSIDDMSILVFIITFMLPSICHMDMAMEEKFRPVFFQQRAEDLKSLVGEVSSVIELISRGVGDQNIESAFPEKLEPQFGNPLLHLPFRILVRPGLITHGTAKP